MNVKPVFYWCILTVNFPKDELGSVLVSHPIFVLILEGEKMETKLETESNLKSVVENLASRLPSLTSEYYSVTLTGDRQGRILRSIYSHWVDWADKDRRIEIRAASIIRAEIVVSRLRKLGERCLVVDGPNDLSIFILVGGHAVIEKKMAESEIKSWLQLGEYVSEGLFGFTSVSSLPSNFRNKAPRPKLRMEVLKRDDYRCRVCGRSPTNHLDIELHVHHIRPWADGGPTTARNLITLCHTCHNGLSPHYEPALHHVVDPQNNPKSVADHVTAYNEGVRQYSINMFATEFAHPMRSINEKFNGQIKY